MENDRMPRGIQTLLRVARSDEEFCRELVEQRAGAATSIGVMLTSSEHAILAAMPADHLLDFIRAVPESPPPRRQFLHQSAASAAVLLGGAVLAESTSGCDRPPLAKGIAPDLPPEGTASAQTEGPLEKEPIEPPIEPAPPASATPTETTEPAPPPPPPPNTHPKSRGISHDMPPERKKSRE